MAASQGEAFGGVIRDGGRPGLRGAEHRQVIKPIPLPRPIPDGFNRDFVIDHDARAATCPAGHTVAITAKGHATFGTRCRDCPLRSRCTTAKLGVRLAISQHDAELVEARRSWRDESVVDDYRRWRPMVERSIAWLVRKNRRVPYRGVERNQLWLGLRVATINLRRLVNLGLTRGPTGWTLAA